MGDILRQDNQSHETLTRRTFLKDLGLGGVWVTLGSTEEGLRRILANEHHMEDPTTIVRRELERHHARKVIEDPERWFAAHRDELLAPDDVRWVVKCVDGGMTLKKLIPLLIKSGKLPREILEELKRGRIPRTLDDFSIPGPGSQYSPDPELHAHLPMGRCCGVAGHHECGACGNVDQDADTSAQAFNTKIGASYLGLLKELDRPMGIHPEIGITLRYTPCILNPRRIEGDEGNQDGYPPDFDYGAWGVQDRKSRLGHYKLITSIVRGDHGAGTALKNGIPYHGNRLQLFRLMILANKGEDHRTIEAELDEGFEGLSTEKFWINIT